MLSIMFRLFGFNATKTINYLPFQSFDVERTRWRLFQKRVVRTKFDIYDFIFDIVSVQLGSEYDMHILHTQYIDECYNCKILRSKIRASTHQSSVLIGWIWSMNVELILENYMISMSITLQIIASLLIFVRNLLYKTSSFESTCLQQPLYMYIH